MKAPTQILSYLPGWVLMFLGAVMAQYLSGLWVIAGKSVIEAAVFGVCVGVFLRNLRMLPDICTAGVRKFEKILVVGIVLLGASLNISSLAEHSLAIFVIVILTMAIGLISILLISRALGFSKPLSLLLAVGTCICGGTAIAVTAPLIHARDEETGYAIGTIALWGLAAIFIYPPVAHSFSISDLSFGVFAGTAIHSTAQVVGAGMIYSPGAANIATAVKLIRNCFLAPVAMVAMFIAARDTGTASDQSSLGFAQVLRGFPWFLFAYFVVAFLCWKGFIAPDMAKQLSTFGKFFILAGLVGVGLNTDLRAFRGVGIGPLGVGLIGSTLVAVLSASLIYLLL